MANITASHPDVQNLLATMDPYKPRILFAQEVFCCRRPKWALCFFGTAHIVWYWMTFSDIPILAQLSLISFAWIATSAIVRHARMRHLFDRLSIPSSLPTNPHNRNLKPLRTLPEIATAIVTIKAEFHNVLEAGRRRHIAQPGEVTFLACSGLLLAAFFFKHIPTSVVSYFSMLTLLLFPALERFVPACKMMRPVHRYASKGLEITLRLTDRVFSFLPQNRYAAEPMQPSNEHDQSDLDPSAFDTSVAAAETAAAADTSDLNPQAFDSVLDGNVEPATPQDISRQRGWSLLNDDDNRDNDDMVEVAQQRSNLRIQETEEGFQNVSINDNK